MMFRVVDYEIIDHGVEHEQYFVGCGITHTDFDACFTGVGRSPCGALRDAWDQMALQDYIVPTSFIRQVRMANTVDLTGGREEYHYYVSVRVKVDTAEVGIA